MLRVFDGSATTFNKPAPLNPLYVYTGCCAVQPPLCIRLSQSNTTRLQMILNLISFYVSCNMVHMPFPVT